MKLLVIIFFKNTERINKRKKLLLLLFFIGFGRELDDLETKSSEINNLIQKCENGNERSCHYAGLFYLKKKNYMDGETYLKIGCEKLEYWPCCYQIGLIYRISKNIPQDLKKVKYYYKKACKFGSKLACNSLKGL